MSTPARAEARHPREHAPRPQPEARVGPMPCPLSYRLTRCELTDVDGAKVPGLVFEQFTPTGVHVTFWQRADALALRDALTERLGGIVLPPSP